MALTWHPAGLTLMSVRIPAGIKGQSEFSLSKSPTNELEFLKKKTEINEKRLTETWPHFANTSGAFRVEIDWPLNSSNDFVRESFKCSANRQ